MIQHMRQTYGIKRVAVVVQMYIMVMALKMCSIMIQIRYTLVSTKMDEPYILAQALWMNSVVHRLSVEI